jgi:hypothetical protein
MKYLIELGQCSAWRKPSASIEMTFTRCEPEHGIDGDPTALLRMCAEAALGDRWHAVVVSEWNGSEYVAVWEHPKRERKTA